MYFVDPRRCSYTSESKRHSKLLFLFKHTEMHVSNHYCELTTRKGKGLIFLILFKVDSCIQNLLMSILRKVLEPYMETATHPENYEDSILSSEPMEVQW